MSVLVIFFFFEKLHVCLLLSLSLLLLFLCMIHLLKSDSTIRVSVFPALLLP